MRFSWCVGAMMMGTIAAHCVKASVIDPELPGSTQYDGWDPLFGPAFSGYGTFPGSGAWPSPIGSNQTGSGDAVLRKLANGVGGGPYPASTSMYFGGFNAEENVDGGKLGVEDVTPVKDVVNVVLQIEIGEAFGYDLWNDTPPVLSYNGGMQELPAVYADVLDREYAGTFESPIGEQELFVNTHLVQWDLRGIDVPITELVVSFHGVQHSQLYALRLDQSDVYVSLASAPACPADFNGDEVRDVADLFGYINAWLSKTASADFNGDTFVDVADLFGFINAWLAGC